MTDGKKTERAKRAIVQEKRLVIGCRPLRGLFLLTSNYTGVPLRSTPGFMLSLRFAGSVQLLTNNFLGHRFPLDLSDRRLSRCLVDCRVVHSPPADCRKCVEQNGNQ